MILRGGDSNALFQLEALKYLEKDDAQETASLSQIGKYMRKHRRDIDFDPSKPWQLAYEKKRAKLAIMLAIYLFFNQDNAISKEEEKSLTKIIKREKILLDHSDIDYLQSFTKRKPSEQTFVDYLRVNQFKEDLFEEAKQTIYKDIHREKGYSTILDHLEKAIEDVIKVVK